MTELDVACVQAADGWSCRVSITDADGSATGHTVTVSRGELDRLAAGHSEPHLLVNASFRFLLSREPKESILRRFALSDIEHYFPEYPRAIAARLRG